MTALPKCERKTNEATKYVATCDRCCLFEVVLIDWGLWQQETEDQPSYGAREVWYQLHEDIMSAVFGHIVLVFVLFRAA